VLSIGNKYPSVPIVYGADVSENYETMKIILQLINYDLPGWRIYCDLKVVVLLTGLKKDMPILQCALCFLFLAFYLLFFSPLQSFYRQLYFLLRIISCFFRSSLTFVSGDIKQKRRQDVKNNKKQETGQNKKHIVE